MVHKFIRGVSNVTASIIIPVCITLLFVGLIGSGMQSNLNKIDDLVKTTANDPVLKAELVKQLEKEADKGKLFPAGLTKDTVKVYCKDTSGIIPHSVCNNLKHIADSELAGKVIAGVARTQADKFIDKVLVKQAKKQIPPVMKKAPVQVVIKYFPIIGILGYLLAVLLIFVHSNFNWKHGLYTLCFKTSFNLLAVLLFLIVISLLTGDSLAGLVKTLAGSALPSGAPEIALKLTASLVLNWITLTTNTVLLMVLATLVPFVGGTIILFFVRRKERLENEAKMRREFLEEPEKSKKA